jgi:hypothetical protein
LEGQLEKAQKNDDKNLKEYEDYKRELEDVSEYEESYKIRIAQ